MIGTSDSVPRASAEPLRGTFTTTTIPSSSAASVAEKSESDTGAKSADSLLDRSISHQHGLASTDSRKVLGVGIVSDVQPARPPSGGLGKVVVPAIYPSLAEFCRIHRIRLTGRFAGPWRLTPPYVGWINGLSDSSYGTLAATNGIDCYIVRGDGTLFEGHIGWFVKDPAHRSQPAGNPRDFASKRPTMSEAQMEALMQEYK